MIPKEKQRSISRKKTGIAPLWTKVMTESTFLEAMIVVTQGARFTTTPYLPIHGAITGVKGFWWLSILLLMIVGLRLKIFHVKPLIDFHRKILFKWFTASFCGPHSWTLHVGLLPRRMEPGWSLAIIIIFCDADHESDHEMIMIMTIVTFPGGCCTSRETTGAGSFTGISQTTMGGLFTPSIRIYEDMFFVYDPHRYIDLYDQLAPCELYTAWLPATTYELDLAEVKVM